jgi:hypothetical protein
LRGSRYGDLSIVPDYATLTTKYAVAANATFANLDSPAGWNTQGSVDIASGTGSATLNEVSTSQTRLSQVFMLNEQDRYLSFTLSGTALDDLNGAPDDAFEAALLDANTGLSVLGGNGLTRTDSFLNLQADGTQHIRSRALQPGKRRQPHVSGVIRGRPRFPRRIGPQPDNQQQAG